MRDAQFDIIIKSIDELKGQNKDLELVKATVLFYHLPRQYRMIYSRMSEDKIQQILKAAPGSKPEDYGFSKDKDGKYYTVDRYFDQEKEINAQDAVGLMTEERVKNLTTIVQFLEKQGALEKKEGN